MLQCPDYKNLQSKQGPRVGHAGQCLGVTLQKCPSYVNIFTSFLLIRVQFHPPAGSKRRRSSPPAGRRLHLMAELDPYGGRIRRSSRNQDKERSRVKHSSRSEAPPRLLRRLPDRLRRPRRPCAPPGRTGMPAGRSCLLRRGNHPLRWRRILVDDKDLRWRSTVL